MAGKIFSLRHAAGPSISGLPQVGYPLLVQQVTLGTASFAQFNLTRVRHSPLLENVFDQYSYSL